MNATPSTADLLAHDVLVSSDNAWQRRARLLQAQWREARGYPIGRWSNRPDDGRVLGSRMAMPDARTHGWNFLTPGIIEQVHKALVNAQTGALINEVRLFGDLLSSQPLAFNAFGELAADRDLATAVSRQLFHPDATVKAVEFEYSPGRSSLEFTGTRSAFDVFVEYSLPDSRKGFTGIEVKYHEDLAQGPKGEAANARCEELSLNAFATADVQAFWNAPVWQLWLDDLLARSMLMSAYYAVGEFVVLAPRENSACAAAVSAYNSLIAPSTIRLVTLEEYVHAVTGITGAAWGPALAARYLGPPAE